MCLEERYTIMVHFKAYLRKELPKIGLFGFRIQI